MNFESYFMTINKNTVFLVVFLWCLVLEVLMYQSLFLGFRLSPQTLTAIVKRYSKNGRIFFDDYVACCVKLRALTGIDSLKMDTVIT